jgi:hypothetical protein
MSSFTPGCGCIRLRKALEIFRWEWAEGQVVGGIVNKPDKQEIPKSEPQSVTLFSRGLRMKNEESPIFSRVLTHVRIKTPKAPPANAPSALRRRVPFYVSRFTFHASRVT